MASRAVVRNRLNVPAEPLVAWRKITRAKAAARDR